MRRILLIGGRTVSVYEVRGGRLSAPLIYAQDGAGLAAFADDLRAWAPCPHRIVSDLAEEQFTAERLPHVLPFERRQMLARRLNVLYRDTPYRCAWPQGRESSGRRDDRYLLAALTQPDLISPWIEALHAQRQPLEGVLSVALLAEDLARRMRLDHFHLLLVSLGGMSGLRQSFLSAGQLAVSRSTPVRRLSAEAYAATVVHETGRMLEFLQHSRLLPESAVLHTVVLGGAAALRALPASPVAASFLRFHPLPVVEAAARLGLVLPAADDDRADALWAGLAARHRPANAYAWHEDRRYLYHRWAAWGLYGAAALLLVSAGAGAVAGFTRAAALWQERDRLAAQAVQLSGMPQTLARDRTGLSGQQLRAVVERYRGLERARAWPGRAAAQLGQVLQAMPDITLQRLHWQAPGVAVPSTPAAAAPAAADAPPEGDAPRRAQELLRLDASLEPMDMRDALARIETLKAALSALPGVKVTVLQLPVALSSDQALSSDGAEPHGKPLRFSLQIEWPPAKTP